MLLTILLAFYIIGVIIGLCIAAIQMILDDDHSFSGLLGVLVFGSISWITVGIAIGIMLNYIMYDER